MTNIHISYMKVRALKFSLKSMSTIAFFWGKNFKEEFQPYSLISVWNALSQP